MATTRGVDALIADLEDAVQKSLAYFAGPGSQSHVRVGIWEPREVLCHMIYWHQATAEGMESVASGGQPVRLYAPTDELNARAVGRKSGKGVSELVEEMSSLQERVVKAARAMPDLDAVVLVRSNGAEMTARQRLEAMTRHWKDHLAELESLRG